MIILNKTSKPVSIDMDSRTGFLLLREFSTAALPMPNAAAKGLAFFQQLSSKYINQRTFEHFPLLFLRLPHLSDTPVIEYQLSFKPLFHWTLVPPSLTRSLTPSVTRSITQLLTRSFDRSTSFITLFHEEKRETKSEPTYLIHQSPDAAAERIRADIFNYFSTLSRITRQESAVSINRLITRSLTSSLTPSVTQSLTQLLTRSFDRSTSFITLLHEEKRETKSEPTYLIHQSPDAAAERIRADIFNYFSTLSRVTSQAAPASINRLITSSLTRSLTPSVTRSLTQLLTRSFIRSTSFITLLQEQKKETKNPRIQGEHEVRPYEHFRIERRGEPRVRPTERIRADIFNYFSTLSRITRQESAVSINRLITRSLTSSLTPSVTQSLTQLLTRSFDRSTSFITLLHEHEKEKEIKSERVKEFEREMERSRTGSETHFTFPIIDTNDDTTLIHQSPHATGERIRADIFNYFSTLSRITRQASTASINRLITSSLTRTLTPSVTRSLTQLLTRSFSRSTSFITHLQEEKKEIKSETIKEKERERRIEYIYLSHQSPDAAAERIRADIFNYFSTLSRVTRQSSAASINRLITSSLTRTLTPSVTRSLTQLLTRSFIHSTSFITHLHEQKREVKSERVKELERERERSRTASESQFTFPVADTGDTTLIHQSPDAAAERIRADIFNYFSTLSRVTSQAAPASINHLITSSLTRSLTPSLTRSLTQLLTRSYNRSTSFITQLHEQEREVKSERIKELELQSLIPGSESPFTFPIADTRDTSFSHHSPDAAAERIRTDIFNYFSTLSRVTSQSSAASINRLIRSSLTRSLTPSLTRSLTQFLTHSFIHSPSFITYLQEIGQIGDRPEVTYQVRPTETRDRETANYTYLIHQSPDDAGERIRADIFNYFSTLNKVWTAPTTPHAPPFGSSIDRLMTPSLTPPLTPSLTRSLTQILTRSFNRFNSFITHLRTQKIEREIRERERKIEMVPAAGEKTRDWTFQFLTTGSESPFKFPIADTKEFYLSRQSPAHAAERIRADIFNYFSTLTRITREASTASINRMTTTFLTPASAPSVTPSFTQLSTRSFSPSTSFINHFHERNKAFITYLHKGREEKESKVEMGTAAAEETRAGKLEMKKPAPRTYGEALREKAPLPELSGFERERLELRYTSAFYLAGKGKQDTQVPHTHTRGQPLSMPTKEWLSSGAVKANIVENSHAAPGGEDIAHFLEKGREQVAASRSSTTQRIIDLSTLAEGNDSRRRPMIKHAPPPENGLSEERIKKIEHTIASHTKQFETRMKDAVTTSASSFAAGISSGVQQDLNLSSLTDNIYNLLVERVKRERRMMGY